MESDKEKNHFLAFNLMEGINVHAIEAKIAKYQEENAEQIMINKARKIVQNKIAMFFTLSTCAGELAAALAASKGHPLQNETDARPTGGMGPQPPPLGGGGHDMHGYAFDDIEMMKVRAERGGRAGGWSGEMSRKRAVGQGAFGFVSSVIVRAETCLLFHGNKIVQSSLVISYTMIIV
ncbi:uncharacterized protein LOC126587377 [Malus sylvestris]|uniref:uncharacterized protein LOC126587377 n=1 Tax=Malus sylvestris TaxID=3752 RepID=UPI0021ACDECF|nr:uncharacterized protein LOC126587377 [Malus sylvestris]